MRIGLISDIHNEFLRADDLPVPDIRLDSNIEILVLAGDIDIKGHGARWAVRQAERLSVPVIYVMGNHEYYESDKYLTAVETAKEITISTQVHVLDCESVEIKGILFVGATLWTDFKLLGDDLCAKAMTKSLEQMNDFNEIKVATKIKFPKVTPDDMIRWHEHSVSYIKNALSAPFAGKRIVVTHHAPSITCLPDYDQDKLLSVMYASNLDKLIEQYQPTVWFHGHIHEPKTQRIGKTLVMSHPKGYPSLSKPVNFLNVMTVVL